MSEDEGTDLAGADAEQAEDDAAQEEVAQAAESASESEPETDGASETDAAGATERSSENGSGGEPRRAGDKLAERVGEHDEGLGREVEALIQKALELKGEVTGLEDTVKQKEERIAELEGNGEHVDELEANAERIDELEARIEEYEAEIEEYEAEIEEYEEQVTDLKERLKHKQADFQNYKKRQDREKERIRKHATEDLVERLVDVRDNLKRAVEGDHDDIESIREGVKMTLKEFDRVLDAENVVEVEPELGEEVDPQRHEVMMRVDSGQPEGTIADVYSPGYEMADKVIETAQVTVSTGEAPEEDDGEEETDDETDDADADGRDEEGGDGPTEGGESTGESSEDDPTESDGSDADDTDQSDSQDDSTIDDDAASEDADGDSNDDPASTENAEESGEGDDDEAIALGGEVNEEAVDDGDEKSE